MIFDILISDLFVNICTDEDLFPINNKYVLSLLNDFEDGTWRYSKFQNFIWDNIAQTALSQQEREKLIFKSHSELVSAAKKLRLEDKNSVGKGSELAEIALYGIMKDYYKALPVVPKIFYKQNSQDNAKGADSVHIVIEDKKDFSLWYGEAKFYNSIEDYRLDRVVKSVENSLNSETLKKENSIITNINDIDYLVDDCELCKKIKDALSSKKSLDSLKPKINIPILLLYECEITNKVNCISEEYKKELIEYHKERANKYFKKQIEKLKSKIFDYEKIKFHLILFPVPSKEKIVDKFTSNLRFYREQ